MLFEFLKIIFSVFRSLFYTKKEAMIEIASLRTQLASYKKQRRKPRLSKFDRLFWVLMRKFWQNWERSLFIVQPDTVVKWQKEMSKSFWAFISKKPKNRGRPRIAREQIALIKRMANENVTWGASRIHGELLMLGYDICERTVARYMPRNPRTSQTWKTFLQNHSDTICAIDFFTEYSFPVSFKRVPSAVIRDNFHLA